MSVAAEILQVVAPATSDYEPQLVRPELLLLGKLGLHVGIRRPMLRQLGAGYMLVAEFRAGPDASRQDIGVTCVGVSTERAQAINETAAQWCFGVLPVLVAGCGEHTCLVSELTLELSTESHTWQFTALLGPVVERGEHDAGEDALPTVEGYLELLAKLLGQAKLPLGQHWLECFAIRSADGSVDATCRLDNRDWAPGQQALIPDANTWPGTTPSYHSRRQFILLLPAGGESPAPPARPGLFARLFGRR